MMRALELPRAAGRLAPSNWDPSQIKSKKLVTDRHVHLNVAWRTPQFWLLWGV